MLIIHVLIAYFCELVREWACSPLSVDLAFSLHATRGKNGRGRLGTPFRYTGEGWEEVSKPATQGKAGRRFPGLLHMGRLGRVDCCCEPLFSGVARV